LRAVAIKPVATTSTSDAALEGRYPASGRQDSLIVRGQKSQVSQT